VVVAVGMVAASGNMVVVVVVVCWWQWCHAGWWWKWRWWRRCFLRWWRRRQSVLVVWWWSAGLQWWGVSAGGVLAPFFNFFENGRRAYVSAQATSPPASFTPAVSVGAPSPSFNFFALCRKKRKVKSSLCA
jgi:hypothetical protein